MKEKEKTLEFMVTFVFTNGCDKNNEKSNQARTYGRLWAEGRVIVVKFTICHFVCNGHFVYNHCFVYVGSHPTKALFKIK